MTARTPGHFTMCASSNPTHPGSLHDVRTTKPDAPRVTNDVRTTSATTRLGLPGLHVGIHRTTVDLPAARGWLLMEVGQMGTIVSAVLLLAACFGSAYVATGRNRRRRREGKRVPSERAWWVWVLVLMPLLVAVGIWSILDSSVIRDRKSVV